MTQLRSTPRPARISSRKVAGVFITPAPLPPGSTTKTVRRPRQRSNSPAAPWGKLYSINANTGDIAWQSVVGITEGLPASKQNTGGGGSAGPIATAGGVVFIGATPDNRFRAIDSKTGKELWVTQLGKNANANPMTYQAKDGKQYVAIVAVDSVYVFALP